MDVKVTGDGTDVDMSSGGLELVRDAAAIAQHVVTRLRTWQTESHYDRAAGVPYISGVFGGELPVEAAVHFLELEALGTPGVQGLVERIAIDVDGTTRAMTASGKVRTDENETLPIFLTLPVQPEL